MTMAVAAAQAATALARPEGVQATVRVTVIADGQGMNILSPYSLFPYGWEVHYSGSPEGSTWEVPGVKTFRLRVVPRKAHAYVDLVKIPAAGGLPAGVTIFDPSNAAHTRLRKYAFVIDTGAESSLVTFADRDVLTRAGFAGLPVIGIGGGCQPLGGGLLDFVFPGSRVRPLRASAVAWFDEAPTHNRVALTQVAATYGGVQQG